MRSLWLDSAPTNIFQHFKIQISCCKTTNTTPTNSFESLYMWVQKGDTCPVPIPVLWILLNTCSTVLAQWSLGALKLNEGDPLNNHMEPIYVAIFPVYVSYQTLDEATRHSYRFFHDCFAILFLKSNWEAGQKLNKCHFCPALRILNTPGMEWQISWYCGHCNPGSVQNCETVPETALMEIVKRQSVEWWRCRPDLRSMEALEYG